MGAHTGISWTDRTFNPWWGCAHVSPGCNNCYAETFAHRVGRDGLWGKGGDRKPASEATWREPVKWERAAEQAGRPALVFCASMADVFEDRRDLDSPRARLFDLIRETPWLRWQLLTKRPEHVLDLVPDDWKRSIDVPLGGRYADPIHRPSRWPSNCWLGTTVEDQRRADERIPILLAIPAPVRFLSCEPLLGPVDLSRWLHLEWMDALDDPASRRVFGGDPDGGGWGREMFAALAGVRPGVHWVIAGGESGAGHRPLVLDHARALREQCEAAGVPYFFKQVGGATPKAGGDLLDGEAHRAFPPEATDGLPVADVVEALNP